jgi:hypothetical protein
MIQFYARFEPAAGLLQRLLQPFAVLSLAPARLVLRPSGRCRSIVAMSFEGLEWDRAELVGSRLAQIPGVSGVRVRQLRSDCPHP